MLETQPDGYKDNESLNKNNHHQNSPNCIIPKKPRADARGFFMPVIQPLNI